MTSDKGFIIDIIYEVPLCKSIPHIFRFLFNSIDIDLCDWLGVWYFVLTSLEKLTCKNAVLKSKQNQCTSFFLIQVIKTFSVVKIEGPNRISLFVRVNLQFYVAVYTS